MPDLTALEKYNKARERMGLEPLTELPANSNGNPKLELSDDDKAKVEAKKLEDAKIKAAADAEAEKLAKAEEAKKKKEELEAIKAAAVNDESVFEYLKKNKGLTISSLDELNKKPNAEDEQKEKEERERNKMSYGFTKVFSKKEYDAYTSDVANKNELVFQTSFAAAKHDDPELKEDEYRAEFNEKYSVDEDSASRKFKEGQRILSNIANSIIQNRHSKILKLDEVYSNYENEENARKSSEMKILANAPAYKKDVEAVVASLAKVKTSFGENDEIEVDVSPEALTEVQNTLLDSGFAQKQIAKGWTKDELSEVAEMLLWKKDRANIIKRNSEAYHKNHLKGSHGILPSRRGEKVLDTNVIDEKLKKAAERHGVQLPDKN